MPDSIITFEGKVIFGAKTRRDGNHSEVGKIDTLIVAILPERIGLKPEPL
ncbi:hypothetical protein [Microcoleus sp. N9_A1]